MHLQMHHLNWIAILVAAVSTMVVGFLWYSPLLFAKAWMREMGYDPNDKARMEEMKKTAGPAYAGSFVASLLSAFTLCLSTNMPSTHTAEKRIIGAVAALRACSLHDEQGSTMRLANCQETVHRNVYCTILAARAHSFRW